MPRSRKDAIEGMENLLRKYPTTGGKAPKVPKAPKIEVPKIKKAKPTYITPNLRGEDRKWLQEFLVD